MVNTLTLSENLIIILGSMGIVLAILILYAISLVIKLTKMTAEEKIDNRTEKNNGQSYVNNNATAQASIQSFDDSDDDEDRLVVALAASIMAANDRPDSHFHISKITRIK